MVLADGTVSADLSNYRKPLDSSFFTGGDTFKHGDLWYSGYEALDTLFNLLVTRNVDKYSYESTVE